MPFVEYLKFIKHKIIDLSPEYSRKWQVLNKETERLVNQVKKEMQASRATIEQRENPKLLKTYQKMLSTLD